MGPVYGSQPFAVLLCHPSDVQRPGDNRNARYYEDLFFNDPRSLNTYWRDVSRNNINLDGTEVFDWRRIDQTRAQFDHKGSLEKISDIIRLFGEGPDLQHRVDFTRFKGVAVVVADGNTSSSPCGVQSVSVASNNVPLRLVICASESAHATIAHEFGHSFGLDHSFDTTPVVRFPISDDRLGSYGDFWDIMSGDLSKAVRREKYRSGPSLNAVNLDLLGWLGSRVFEPWPNYIGGALTLEALNDPSGPGHVAADLWGDVVEFRMNDNWDGHVGGDALGGGPFVQVHALDYSPENGLYHSVVLRGSSGFTLRDGDHFVRGSNDPLQLGSYLRVTVRRIDRDRRAAHLGVHYRPRRRLERALGLLDTLTVGQIEILQRVPPKDPGPGLLKMFQQVEALWRAGEFVDRRTRALIRREALANLSRLVADEATRLDESELSKDS